MAFDYWHTDNYYELVMEMDIIKYIILYDGPAI